MSIPLKDSPFRDRIPCKFATENHNEIFCNASDSKCAQSCSGSEDCPFYKSLDESEFKDLSTEKESEVEFGSIYQHFKGKKYQLVCTGRHTETDEVFVIYKAMYPPYYYWVRPLDMFLENVEALESHYRGPRFRKVSEE